MKSEVLLLQYFLFSSIFLLSSSFRPLNHIGGRKLTSQIFCEKNSGPSFIEKVWRQEILKLGKNSLVFLSVFFSISNAYASTKYPELERFRAGLGQLRNLDNDWDKVVQGNGDNIRRYLGTVYTPPTCTSPLCSFATFTDKFTRAHLEDFDIDEFEEPKAALLTALNQADFLAYSSIFSEYGNGGGGANYLSLSHDQVKKSIKCLEEVIKILEENN